MIVLADTGQELLGKLAGVGRVHHVHTLDEVPPETHVLVCGPGIAVDEVLELAEEIQGQRSGPAIVLVAARLSGAQFRAALRAGVRDALPASARDEQLREAVRHLELVQGSSGEHAAAAPRQAGKVVTMFGAKGGIGKSFVASNLAVLLAERTNADVALVDLDFDAGDLPILLRLFPPRTIYDVAQNIDTIDDRALRGYMGTYRDRVHLLASPLEPGVGEKIGPPVVRTVIDLLRATFRFVVVDCPGGFTDQAVTAIDASDECVLLAGMDVPSIKNAKLSLDTLRLLGVQRDRVHVVLNRADDDVGLRRQDVEKGLGTRVDHRVPAMKEVTISINRGVPIVVQDPDSPVTSALRALADAVGGFTTKRKKLLQRGP